MWYKLGVRVTLVLAFAFLFLRMNAAETRADVAVERANSNFALLQNTRVQLDTANDNLKRQITFSNSIVTNLAEAAESQRAMNAATIRNLQAQSGRWDSVSQSLRLPELEGCENRMNAIDTFLDAYFVEAAS